jgi:hypothetical protein
MINRQDRDGARHEALPEAGLHFLVVVHVRVVNFDCPVKIPVRVLFLQPPGSCYPDAPLCPYRRSPARPAPDSRRAIQYRLLETADNGVRLPSIGEIGIVNAWRFFETGSGRFTYSSLSEGHFAVHTFEQEDGKFNVSAARPLSRTGEHRCRRGVLRDRRPVCPPVRCRSAPVAVPGAGSDSRRLARPKAGGPRSPATGRHV